MARKQSQAVLSSQLAIILPVSRSAATTFYWAQIQAFNGTQTVNTGEVVLTLTSYSGSASASTINYSYTLSAAINNATKVPTGNDTVDSTGFNDSIALTVHGVG